MCQRIRPRDTIAFGERTAPRVCQRIRPRDTPFDLRELKRFQFIENFFWEREAALLLQGGAKQFNKHDMLPHSQNDLGHQNLIILSPGAVCVNAFGKCEKSVQRHLVRPVREAKRGILRRHSSSCSKEKANASPHQIFEHFRICHPMRLLRQQLRKGPVVPGRIEVVNDQENPVPVLRHPAQVKVVKRINLRMIHGKRVAEANRRDRVHKVVGINSVNTCEAVGSGGIGAGE